jgi:cytochrome c oxidase subunit 2
MRYPSAERMKAWAKKEGESGYEDPRRFAQDKHADDIVLVSELHAWQNQRVLVQLKTQDVLHSFYLPNLRLKQDAVPGKTIPVWFMATEPNTKLNGDHWEDGKGRNQQTGKPEDPNYVWDLVCAELCGWGHYKMQGRLFVHPTREDYLAWLAHAQSEQNRHNP